MSPGEACDDGNDDDDDDCTSACAPPACGDGFLQSSEECDDGNEVDTDGCMTNCAEGPETPTLELSLAQVKQFELSWEPAQGASWYELWERADVGEELVQVGGELAGESVSLTVPLFRRANASYELRACNDVRCSSSEPVDVTGTLAEAVGYFKASNTDPNDAFGYSLALSADGRTLAVGAFWEDSSATGIDGDQDDDSAQDSGAVYVFVRDGAVWSQQAYVKASNTDPDDELGTSVALSSDGSTGAVYLY